MDLLIVNGLLLLAEDNTYAVRRGSIGVSGGRISTVTADVPADIPDLCHVIDAQNMLVLPGLINAHIHSYGCLFRTPFPTTPLETWMALAREERGTMDAHALAIGSTLTAAHALLSGTTTLLDHAAGNNDMLNTLADTYVRIGIRAVIAPQVSNTAYINTLPAFPGKQPPLHASLCDVPATTHECLDVTEQFVTQWHGYAGRISTMVGPSAPTRCTDELLRGLADIANRYAIGIHTHLLETEVQRWAAHDHYGTSMVAHLEQLGLINERTLLAHGVWLTANDIARLYAAGSSVIHNPASNLLLGSGTAPLPLLTAAGVNVGLGTDGLNSSGSMSMFESMKLATVLHRTDTANYDAWLQPADALRMATLNGARAVGMGKDLGALQTGMLADMVLMRRDTLSLVPLLDPVSQLVLGEHGSGVDTVIVGGQVVVQNRQLTQVDMGEVVAEACAMAERGLLTRSLPPEQRQQIELALAAWY